MRNVRVHVELDLAGQTEIELPQGPAHHLLRVLRLRSGAHITLFDGSGLEYPARIERLDSHGSCRVRLEPPRRPAVESSLKISLIQAIGRGDRMDWCVQKATELGVARIQPVYTERTEVRLDSARADKRRRHWQQIAIAAAEQSGRVQVPPVETPQALENLVDGATCGYYLDPAAGRGPGELAPPEHALCPVVIGPEGGLSRNEIARLDGAGFLGLRLGPRVLRTETAGPVILAVLQARFGDLA